MHVTDIVLELIVTISIVLFPICCEKICKTRDEVSAHVLHDYSNAVGVVVEIPVDAIWTYLGHRFVTELFVIGECLLDVFEVMSIIHR